MDLLNSTGWHLTGRTAECAFTLSGSAGELFAERSDSGLDRKTLLRQAGIQTMLPAGQHAAIPEDVEVSIEPAGKVRF